MQPFDIYQFAEDFHECPDRRPWLIIKAIGDDRFACFPIASRADDQGKCFQIASDDDHFAATGLTKTCYIHYSHVYKVAGDKIRAGTRKGCLNNNLLELFKFTCDL